MATTWRSRRLASTMARSTLRPMRPKPEIAILMAMGCSVVSPPPRNFLRRGNFLGPLLRRTLPTVNMPSRVEVNNADSGDGLRSRERWLTPPRLAPIVCGTRGKRRRRRRLIEQRVRRWPHAAQPRPGASLLRCRAPCARQSPEREGDRRSGARVARAARSCRVRARPAERGAGALQDAPAPAGGNPGAGPRPHRLGPGFAAQHPGRQGLTGAMTQIQGNADLRARSALIFRGLALHS